MSDAKKVLRSEKFQCDDGSTWCTIWYPSEEDPEVGHCFDFRFEDIDEIIGHLQELKAGGLGDGGDHGTGS